MTPVRQPLADQKPKLLARTHHAIRARPYSLNTETAEAVWVKRMRQFFETYRDQPKLAPLVRELSRFMSFHSKRHPPGMGDADIGRPLAKPSGAPLQPTSSTAGLNFGQSRNCSATQTFAPR